jgi:hypothetical protein
VKNVGKKTQDTDVMLYSKMYICFSRSMYDCSLNNYVNYELNKYHVFFAELELCIVVVQRYGKITENISYWWIKLIKFQSLADG